MQMLTLPHEEPKPARVVGELLMVRVRHALTVCSSPSRGCARNARAALRPDFKTGAYYNAHGRLLARPGH